MQCNLRPPDAAPVIVHVNLHANAMFEVGRPFSCLFILLRCELDLWLCDLEHL